jgi:O-acetyl-ADP-ribose deacetylase (regulator of RNase III)
MISSHEPQRNSRVVTIRQGEILDCKADYLICSGNAWLNMSGGVNGALLEKYGEHLQKELHDYLLGTGKKAVPPGFCYRWANPIGDYKGVT